MQHQCHTTATALQSARGTSPAHAALQHRSVTFSSGSFATTGGGTSPQSFREVAESPFSPTALEADQPGLPRDAATVLPNCAKLFRNSAGITTLSVFGDITFIPFPKLEINLGGRWLTEDRDSGISARIPNSVISGGPLIAGGINTNGQLLRASGRFDAFLLRANILFRATDNVNLYATCSRGRRSSVVQVNAGRIGGVLAPNVRVFPAELLDNFEAGVKGKWEVIGFANNLSDQEYLLHAGNTGGAFGIPTFIRGLPRLFGVEAVVRY